MHFCQLTDWFALLIYLLEIRFAFQSFNLFVEWFALYTDELNKDCFEFCLQFIQLSFEILFHSLFFCQVILEILSYFGFKSHIYLMNFSLNCYHSALQSIKIHHIFSVNHLWKRTLMNFELTQYSSKWVSQQSVSFQNLILFLFFFQDFILLCLLGMILQSIENKLFSISLEYQDHSFN
mgnify:CR=1 FL=1